MLLLIEIIAALAEFCWWDYLWGYFTAVIRSTMTVGRKQQLKIAQCLFDSDILLSTNAKICCRRHG